jgi:hypothetical protein
MSHARSLLFPLFLLALLASAASAQVRTFVASTGNDANPCSRTAPCRTFQVAVNAAAPGGEVVALDSAGFGSNVSITKSISIVAAPGVYAGITAFSSDGVDINAGPTDAIILRGLTVINQAGGAVLNNGIVFNSGQTLHLENCVMNGFGNGDGVLFQPGGSSNLEVKDSIISGNGSGIFVIGSAQALIDQARLEDDNVGLFVREGAMVTVCNSVVSANGDGVAVASNTTGPAEMNIESCVVSNNRSGIVAGSVSTGVATARVSGSTVTDNEFGLQNLGSVSVILSRGNNTLEGNAANTSGTIGSYTSK